MFNLGCGSVGGIAEMIAHRLSQIASEIVSESQLEQFRFCIPVGLLLVVDEEHGGDVTAQELCRRCRLLDAESRDAIDFYFLGWEWADPDDRAKGIRFNLGLFEDCRNRLKKQGIAAFGGNADLILVDACCERSLNSHPAASGLPPTPVHRYSVDFTKAIYVNLSKGVAQGRISSVGEFLQSIIQVAAEMADSGAFQDSGAKVVRISDRLGLATAKESIVTFVLQKWASVVGGDRLADIAVRNLGPKLDLRKLSMDAVSKGATRSEE